MSRRSVPAPGSQFFISYAREDKKFALGLRRALRARERLAFVDVRNIAALSDWEREISAAIDAADVFVFVISPDSVVSGACRAELTLAVTARKRLAPILLRPSEAVPSELRKPNWIFADRVRSLEALAERLIKAADVDPEWLRQHTWLLTRARAWRNGRAQDQLLSGDSLQDALRWLAQSGQRAERAIARLQAEYIEASRAAAATAAAEQRELFHKAVARQLAAQSYIARGSPEDGVEPAVLLAIESLRHWPTVEGDRAFRQALELCPRAPLVTVEHRGQGAQLIDGAKTLLLSRAGGLRAVALRDATELWNVRSGASDTSPSACAADSRLFRKLKNGQVELRDAGSGKLLERVRPVAAGDRHGDDVVPDDEGSAVLVTTPRGYQRSRVEVWRWKDGAQRASKPTFSIEPDAELHHAALRFGGEVLVTILTVPAQGVGMSTRVVVHNTQTGESASLWEVYGRCTGAVVSSDGQWLALLAHPMMSGAPTTVHVGRLARTLTGEDENTELRTLDHDTPVTSMQADGGERLICFTERGAFAHVWTPFTARLLGRYPCGGRALSARLCPDETTLAVVLESDGDTNRPHRAALLDRSGALRISVPLKDIPADYAVNEQGQLIVCGENRTQVWEADTGSYVKKVPADSYSTPSFSADSARFLVRAPGGGLAVGAVAEREQTIVESEQGIWQAAFVDGEPRRVVIVGNPSFGTEGTRGDSNIRLWDLKRTRVLRELARESLAAVALGPDGRRAALAVPSAGEMQVIEIASGRTLCRVAATDIEELLFDRAGDHVAGRDKAGRATLWRLADASVRATFDAPELQAIDVASGRALTGSAVLSIPGGKPVIEGLNRPSVDFARGRVAFVVDDNYVEVRPFAGRARGGARRLHHPYVFGANFSPDGVHLVTYGADNSARVWQLHGAVEIARFEHPDRVLGASFSPNGHLVATKCAPTRTSYEVTFWSFLPDDLVAEGRRRVTRPLTQPELDRFLPDRATRLPA